MRRDLYIVRDATGHSVAEILTHSGETPEVEPWMVENVRARGWEIVKVDRPESANEIEVHGYADWAEVARGLAEALRPILADENEVESEEQAEAVLDAAQAALDAFDVTMMEVTLTSITHPSEKEDGSDASGT